MEKYRGNKSGLYVDERNYVTQKSIKWAAIRIIIVLLMAAAIFFISKRAFGDALPHVEFQNWERWFAPQPCDEQCCEKEATTQSMEKEEYATIVIDRRTANEIGGMDSTLPGMKVNKNTFLSARILDNGNLEILVFVRGLGCKDCWEVYYASELIMP